MRVSKGMKVARLLEEAMIASFGKPRTERTALIAVAKVKAIEVCKADRERAIVELRAMEKRLFSAIMSKAGPDEIRELQPLIAASAHDDTDQKVIMLGIADRYISGLPAQLG